MTPEEKDQWEKKMQKLCICAGTCTHYKSKDCKGKYEKDYCKILREY